MLTLFCPPICQYGSADIIDKICCQIAEPDNAGFASLSIWLSVVKKSLALSDNDEASAFLDAESNDDEEDYYDEFDEDDDEFFYEEDDEEYLI